MITPQPAPIAGPAWDLSSEYDSLNAPALIADLAEVKTLTRALAKLALELDPATDHALTLAGAELQQTVKTAQAAAALQERAGTLLWNLETYTQCRLSVDGKDDAAKGLLGQLQALDAQLGQAWNTINQLLRLASDELVESYLQAPHTQVQRFALMQDRLLKDQTLSRAEEALIINLRVNGPAAWGTLYDDLSVHMQCQVHLPEGDKRLGLAEAASLTQDVRESVRKSAYRAVQAAWEQQEAPAAAILNALAGWRLSLYERRSYKQPVHFLADPLHRARTSRATLDAMQEAVREAAPAARRVLLLQARVLGKAQLDPWDLFAPCPQQPAGTAAAAVTAVATTYSFADAITMIAAAYDRISPQMGDFVRHTAAQNWIEGTVGGNKRPGAYCTTFPKSRTPRVYMTFTGGMREVKTLAHELGHAFHAWVMRDMPLAATHYPMTLAETASIFGETVLSEALIARADTPASRLSFCWSQAREVESMLLNIPARFAFETAFYEQRQQQPVSPAELKQLMRQAWQTWYGDALTDYDSMFWASKLHFSIADLSFYNFPYTFGYLFALGVYAQRAILGDDFFPAYVALLRDTGGQTVEELAARHLGVDLRTPDFWRRSVATAVKSVDQFAQAIDGF